MARPARRLLLPALVLAGLTAPHAAGAATPTKWLCRPGLANNPCTQSLTATAVATKRVQRTAIPRRPPIDCFYVYPTVSSQPTVNANLHVDPEERAIARFQASRFSQDCRVFAPMYRQVTLTGIADPAKVSPQASLIAYSDVLDAWKEYLRKYNHGRGVVFIGHSQGSFVLKALIASEVDKKPAMRKRMVSALLMGGNVTVRKGRDVGGDFKHIPGCRSARQVGCVVAYSMFDQTPPPNSLFGRPVGAGGGSTAPNLQVLCTNPAALGGGIGTLRPYDLTEPFPGLLGIAVNAFVGPLPKVSTPWLIPPGRYTAHCSSAGGARTLQVAAHGGARVLPPTPDATWGLHLGDVNLALGNLTALVKRETAAYLHRR